MDAKADGGGNAKVGPGLKGKVGARVGALLSGTATTAKFLGWGTFEGREVPGEEAGGFAEFLREAGMENPKIRLDNGKVVWGCECWWGSEVEIQKVLEGKTVEHVDIDEVRRAAQ